MTRRVASAVKAYLPPSIAFCNFLLAAYRSWDTEISLSGRDSSLCFDMYAILMGEVEVSHEIEVPQPLNFALLSLDTGHSVVGVMPPNRLDVSDSLRDAWGGLC